MWHYVTTRRFSYVNIMRCYTSLHKVPRSRRLRPLRFAISICKFFGIFFFFFFHSFRAILSTIFFILSQACKNKSYTRHFLLLDKNITLTVVSFESLLNELSSMSFVVTLDVVQFQITAEQEVLKKMGEFREKIPKVKAGQKTKFQDDLDMLNELLQVRGKI